MAGRLIQTETRIRSKLSKPEKRLSRIEVLALGTGLTASQCRRRLAYLANLFKITEAMSGLDNFTSIGGARLFHSFGTDEIPNQFRRQGYVRAKEHLPNFVLLTYLFSHVTARLLSKPISGDLFLTVCTRMRGIFHLASLFDRKVILEIPEEETVPFPIDSPVSLGLMHLLRKKDPRAFWHIIGDSLSQDPFEIGDSIPHLGSLDPLAPFLHSLSH